MLIETGFEQGSEEWLKARIKSVGGTEVSKIITPFGDISKSRESFIIEMASRKLTGKTKTIYQTYELKWGHDHEPDARGIYAIQKGVKINQCAMVWGDKRKVNHISPDGLDLDNEVGLEIKCPQLKTFIGYKSKGVLPKEHILQVQTCMAVTGWDRWDYVVYFPGLEPLIIEVKRDNALINIINDETQRFIDDVGKLIRELKK